MVQRVALFFSHPFEVWAWCVQSPVQPTSQQSGSFVQTSRSQAANSQPGPCGCSMQSPHLTEHNGVSAFTQMFNANPAQISSQLLQQMSSTAQTAAEQAAFSQPSPFDSHAQFPHGGGGTMHSPVGRWHTSPAVSHTTGSFTQPVTSSQVSSVHRFSSSHRLGAKMQPSSSSQLSSVQAFPSSQATGTYEQPDAGSHESRVQTLESLHCTSTYSHPSTESQESVVQRLPSSQVLAVYAHPVAALHVSTVQAFSSLQVTAACVHAPVVLLHESFVQALLSLHTDGVTRQS